RCPKMMTIRLVETESRTIMPEILFEILQILRGEWAGVAAKIFDHPADTDVEPAIGCFEFPLQFGPKRFGIPADLIDGERRAESSHCDRFFETFAEQRQQGLGLWSVHSCQINPPPLKPHVLF